MPILCLKCKTFFDKNLINYKDSLNDYNVCPNLNCYGKIVEVDEQILETIMILNDKGYYTSFCCSGHVYQDNTNTYIMFHDEVDLPNIPSGFRMEGNNTIRKRYNRNSFHPLLQAKINLTNRLLTKWAAGLRTNPRKKELDELYD